MKLKKIASLMLAGIMAVSMLAACGEGNTINENPGSSSSEPTVQNSAIAEALNDDLSAKQAALLSFSSNAKLASLLNRIATDDEDFEQWDALIQDAARPHRITKGDLYFDDVAGIVNAAYNGSTPAVEFTNAAGTAAIAAIPTNHDNNRTYLYIYTVDASMTEVSEIAAAVMNGAAAGGLGLQDLVYDSIGVVSGGPAGNANNIDYEYDGYAEMVKVTNDNSSDTAYIVAVLVEQHAVTNT